MTWFGRTFSATGVSADPKKINAIIEAGRPKLISFLKHSQELMEHDEALEEEIAFENVKLLLGKKIRLPNSLKRSMRRSFIREPFENWNKKFHELMRELNSDASSSRNYLHYLSNWFEESEI